MRHATWIATLLTLLTFPAALRAQTVIQPSRMTLYVIPDSGDPATVSAVASRSTPVSATLNCNLAPTPLLSPPYVNPRAARVTDVFTAGRECEGLVPTSLASGAPIPNGSYRLVVTAGADNCVVPPSPALVPCETARSTVVIPFSLVLPAAPAAWTGLRVVP